MSPMVRRPPGIEMALLGFLRDGPKHGYQIFQSVSDKTGLKMVWQLKQSQLYALLGKLEKDGDITSVLQQQEAHPPAGYITLPAQGVKLTWVG